MGNTKILVTGATGAIGATAVKTLLEMKVPVRALVHGEDARASRLSAQGAEVVRATYPILSP
jgi:NAD(P)H dehydrogenase (quinone)